MHESSILRMRDVPRSTGGRRFKRIGGLRIATSHAVQLTPKAKQLRPNMPRTTQALGQRRQACPQHGRTSPFPDIQTQPGPGSRARRRLPGAAMRISQSLIRREGLIMGRLSTTSSAISLLGCGTLAFCAAIPLARA